MKNRKQLIATGCSAIACVLLVLVFALWPNQARVTGLVMVDDVALPGATVLFYPIYERGAAPADPGFAMTDESGLYTVYGRLKPGTYQVVVRPPVEPTSKEVGFSEFDSVQREAMLGDDQAMTRSEFMAGFVTVSESGTSAGDLMIESQQLVVSERVAAVPVEQQ